MEYQMELFIVCPLCKQIPTYSDLLKVYICETCEISIEPKK